MFQTRDNDDWKFISYNSWNLQSGWKCDFFRIIWKWNVNDSFGIDNVTKSSGNRDDIGNSRNDFNVDNVNNDVDKSGLEVQGNRFSGQSRNPQMQVTISKRN